MQAATAETRLLTRWTQLLAERRGLLLATVEALPLPTLCAEIGALQAEIALETARGAAALPAGQERTQALAKLRHSRSALDRLAAQFVDRWDAADR